MKNNATLTALIIDESMIAEICVKSNTKKKGKISLKQSDFR